MVGIVRGRPLLDGPSAVVRALQSNHTVNRLHVLRAYYAKHCGDPQWYEHYQSIRRKHWASRVARKRAERQAQALLGHDQTKDQDQENQMVAEGSCDHDQESHGWQNEIQN